jgi:hypothetical protein
VVTASELKTRSLKELIELAKRKKLPGCHRMKKDVLVRALARIVQRESSKRSGTASGQARRVGGNSSGNGTHSRKADKTSRKRSPRLERRLHEVKTKLAEAKDLSFRAVAETNGNVKDRLVLMVRDPFWLHAYWEITGRSVARAKAAMGAHWHGARPVLRLLELDRGTTTGAVRQRVRDIEIHGGVNNWYIDVHDPPRSFQVEIGYLAINGKFYSLARSNTVTTPAANKENSFDKNWAEVAKDFDRVYALSSGYGAPDADSELKEVLEERLQRPVGQQAANRFATAPAGSGGKQREFRFEIDTELIVHGVTNPDAKVTLRGEPIPLRSDGSFAVRFNLPDRRHVLPVVASSSDGVEQRTIVLAVDRNTKVMESVIRDNAE